MIEVESQKNVMTLLMNNECCNFPGNEGLLNVVAPTILLFYHTWDIILHEQVVLTYLFIYIKAIEIYSVLRLFDSTQFHSTLTPREYLFDLKH